MPPSAAFTSLSSSSRSANKVSGGRQSQAHPSLPPSLFQETFSPAGFVLRFRPHGVIFHVCACSFVCPSSKGGKGLICYSKAEFICKYFITGCRKGAFFDSLNATLCFLLDCFFLCSITGTLSSRTAPCFITGGAGGYCRRSADLLALSFICRNDGGGLRNGIGARRLLERGLSESLPAEGKMHLCL